MSQSKEAEKGFWSSLGDSLSSLRLTIGLLIILAVASIFGTVIPQNASPEDYLRIYKFSTYKILKILGFLDMYHGAWFVFLLALLSLNLVACSWKRFRITWKLFFSSGKEREGGEWKSVPLNRKFSRKEPPEKALADIQTVIARNFRQPKIGENGKGSYLLFSEKEKLSRLGVYFIHVSVLVILAGALIGSFFGFRGNVNIVEGETADRVVLRGPVETRPLGFSVRLDQFNVSFYPSGAPREFKSTVTILDGGQKVRTEPILVNHPLTYKGISLYQASYGIAGVEKAVLTVRDRESGREVSMPVRVGTRTEIPGSGSAFLLSRFVPDIQGMGPAFQVLLFSAGQPEANFWIFRDYPELENQRAGRYRFAVKSIEPRYYSGLQVTRDPGVWVVWVGCFLMIAGFYMTFFMSHRRIWVTLSEKGKETAVVLAGSSHRDRLGFEQEFEKIYHSLRGSGGEPAGDSETKEKT